MKLIICEPNLDSPGGRQRVILEIAKKFNPIIYTFAYDQDGTLPEFKDFDVRVPKELKLNSRFTIRTGKAFLNLKLNDYDAINAHWGPSHWVRNNNERVLWYCHSPIRAVYDLFEFRHKSYPFYLKPFHSTFANWYRDKNASIVPKIESILCNSKNTQDRIKNFLHSNATIVHPGVYPQEFENSGYEKFFLVLNRICPTKRLEYAIHAFSIFKQKNPDWKLIIAGSLHEKDKAYYEKIKLLHKDIEINVTDKRRNELLSRCTALLFTSVNEDFGIIPLEAMASSKPVISVNEGGPKETVLNGKTGFLVNSPEHMASSMESLASNSDLVENMGKQGCARVKDNYTWKIFHEQFKVHLKKTSER